MSNKLWTNIEEINAAISAVRNDHDPTQWVLVGFNDKFDELVVVGTGTGTVNELTPHLSDTNAYYALVRKTEVVDQSETVKFVFIKFQGTRIRPLAKGKLTTSMGEITGRFQPFHVDMTTQEVDEISDEKLTDLVGSASMTKNVVLDKNAGQKIIDDNRKKTEALSVNRQYTSGMQSSPTTSQVISSPTTQRTPVHKKEPSQVSAPPTESKDVTFIEENWIKNAIADVRNDNTETDWALVKSDAGQIELVDVGTGGVEELSTKLTPDGVYYGIVRIMQQIDNSITTKFAFVHYIGEQVRPTAKAKISTHKGTVSKIFQPYHVELVTSDIGELTTDNLWGLITAASGTKSNVLDKQGAPASTPKAPTTKVSAVRSPVSTGTGGGLEFNNVDELRGYLQDVRNDQTPTNWLLLTYAANSKNALELVGTGTGGADELAQHLEDSKVYYGIVRAEEVIDQSVTVKFAFVHYLGDRTPPLLKARVSTHKGVAEAFFRPYHVTLFATEASEVNQEHVNTLIAKASQNYNAVLN
jgi:hypothetical protein